HAADARLEGLPGGQRIAVEGPGALSYRLGDDDSRVSLVGRQLLAELPRDRDPRLVIQGMEERPTKHRSPAGSLSPRPAHPRVTTASEKGRWAALNNHHRLEGRRNPDRLATGEESTSPHRYPPVPITYHNQPHGRQGKRGARQAGP